MRDPRAPIPSPTHDRGYWDRTSPPPNQPPSTQSGHPTRAIEASYDPTRLLRHRPGDLHGLDRRGGPRRRGEVDGDPSQALISAGHRRLDAILGLRTRQGWAIVRTLSVAPNGVLLHHVDLLDPELDAPHRLRGQQVLRALAPLMGAPRRQGRHPRPSSPLATVGTCVLSRRVVADVAAWATPNVPNPTVSSRRPDRRELRVSLVIPPAGQAGYPSPYASPVRGGQPVTVVEGDLVPLNDPNPQVLGVSLTPARVRELELLLRQR